MNVDLLIYLLIVDPLETRGHFLGEAPEAIENLDNRRFTAKENTGILGFKRFQATIRRAVWPIGWRPGKETGGMSRPALVSPPLRRVRPFVEKVTCASSPLSGMRAQNS